jgi:kynureninase
VEKAHRVGAQVLFNGYHSVGVIPLDVTVMEVDLYWGILKWLCGGPSGVFMYVHPDLLKTLQPKIREWFAHQQPFAFDLENFVLREDSYRLSMERLQLLLCMLYSLVSKRQTSTDGR